MKVISPSVISSLFIFLMVGSHNAMAHGSQIINGWYTEQDNVAVFTPCRSDKTYRVTGREAMLKKLKAQYQQNISDEGARVYARLKVHFKAIDEESVDADYYAGDVSVSKLKTMTAASAQEC